MGKHAETDFVPSNIEELMKFRRYIIGGFRGLRVPDSDIEDRLQDFWIHCMTTNFFLRVTEKVDAGLMNPKQFRAYLGTTLRNCLVNNWKKENRDPAVGAISTAPVDDDSFAMKGTVDLDRLQDGLNPDDLTIPAEVMESDLIRYIAERKPAFLPTFILRLMGYRPADISRIIGKRKETVHYRVKAIHALVVEYLAVAAGEIEAPAQKASTSSAPVYIVTGENPFQKDSNYHLWETLKAIGTPVTMREVVAITGRLMDQGKFPSNRSPEEVAGTFVAVAQEKDSIAESVAPSIVGGGGHAAPHASRTRYQFTSTENPYKTWGGSFQIFDQLASRGYFDFSELLTVTEALIDSGVIQTRRTPEGVAWGFIETARGYQVLDRVDDSTCGLTPLVSSPKTVNTVTVNTVTVNTITVTPRYRLSGANPYKRGINYNLWELMCAKGEWTRDDLDVVAQELMESGSVTTRRPVDQISYLFFNNLKEYPDQWSMVEDGEEKGAVPTPKISSVTVNSGRIPRYRLSGENPYKRGINYNLWLSLVAKGEWTDSEVADMAQQLVDTGTAQSSRPVDQLSYQFLNTLRKWYPTQCVEVASDVT